MSWLLDLALSLCTLFAFAAFLIVGSWLLFRMFLHIAEWSIQLGERIYYDYLRGWDIVCLKWWPAIRSTFKRRPKGQS